MSDETTLAATPADEPIVNLDQPETPAAEAGAEGEAKTEEADKPEGAGDEAGDEGQSGDDKPKKLSGSRRERLRNEQLRRENEELRAYKDANERRQQAGDDGDKEPQEADFPDYFAYLEAKNAHNTRKIIREEQRRGEESRNQAGQRERWRELTLDHQDRMEGMRAEVDDFDKVLAANKVDFSQHVGIELLQSDKSALLEYYLAKNPDKLQALNEMSGSKLAREIGRLEGMVRMPASNQKTNAPAPITSLKGGAAPAFDPAKSSMDDYIAKRKAGWNG